MYMGNWAYSREPANGEKDSLQCFLETVTVTTTNHSQLIKQRVPSRRAGHSRSTTTERAERPGWCQQLLTSSSRSKVLTTGWPWLSETESAVMLQLLRYLLSQTSTGSHGELVQDSLGHVRQVQISADQLRTHGLM